MLYRLAVVGFCAFFLGVGRAAALYPGGNRFDLKASHYSFFGNFLCDLFDHVAYNGVSNPGRLYALAGTYSLAIALLLFWRLIPALFRDLPFQSRYVKRLGMSAMALSLLIATPLHDGCILIAVPLGLAALILAIHALFNKDEKNLAILGASSVVVSFSNYLSFVFPIFPAAQPGLQKLALISFLTWVFCVLLRLKQENETII